MEKSPVVETNWRCHPDCFIDEVATYTIRHIQNVTRFAKRDLVHARFQDTLFIAIC